MISNYLLPPPSLPFWVGKVSDQPSLLFPVKTPSSTNIFKKIFTQRPAANLLNYVELRLFLLLFRFIIL
jgi:hypothetical protein